jgi:hypothetical protein
MKHIHFLHREQLPVPGSQAKAVRYPTCEWRAPAGDASDAAHHPWNRFVCSWLTSDMADVAHCDEVLHVMAQIEAGTRETWFVDGNAFNVDLQATGVQFNPSNVGPEDTAYWNQAQGRFTLTEVQAVLRLWRDFLAQSR